MKLGVALVFAILCELALTEVYVDQSGYGYGVNPKPSGLVGIEDKKVNPISEKSGSADSITSQESKPEAYLVRLKPKEDQESSSIPNKKSKFLLLLSLPEDHEETQATSLNSEVQQRDEQSYNQPQPIGQSQDSYSAAGLNQQSSQSVDGQRDAVGQYQQHQIGQTQEPQAEEDLGQQRDSDYQQPLQPNEQAQNADQVQQKDDVYNQPQPESPSVQQNPDSQRDFDQQSKDEGYQSQQESGFMQPTVPGPSQFQASALKNGFSPLLSYERPNPQVLDPIKSSRNNFFRSPVLQDSTKTQQQQGSGDLYGSTDSQNRDSNSYGMQRDSVKGQQVQQQVQQPVQQIVHTQSSYDSGSGRKSSDSFVPSRGSTKGSVSSSDSSRKSAQQTSSYPSQQSPMKSPAQVYAQQQIAQSKKIKSNQARDFFGQSTQRESNSFGSQQDFSSGYKNVESVKSVAPKAENQQGLKTQSISPATPLPPVQQSYGKTSENSQGFSNSYESPASLVRNPIASVLSYESGQQEQSQQEENNQSGKGAVDAQERDEQFRVVAERQPDEEEKKVPVILISLPPGGNSYQDNENQHKEESADPQQTDANYQQSGEPSIYGSNYNGPVKGQPVQSYEQNSQSSQTEPNEQQIESSTGLKSPTQRYSTKSSSSQLPVESAAASGQTKGGKSQSQSLVSQTVSGVKGQQSSYENAYSNNFEPSPQNTKSAQSPAGYSVKGYQQSNEDSFPNEQIPVKGSTQSTQDNVQSNYSGFQDSQTLQQTPGFVSQSATKGDFSSNQRQSADYSNFQSSAAQQSQSDLGSNNLHSSTKGGQSQSQQNDAGYQSQSQDSDSQSDRNSYSSVQQQSTSSGYSSAFSAPTGQQTSSDYETNSYQSPASGVKGGQRSSVQPNQQNDAYSMPNSYSQPAFASFSASVKGAAPPQQQSQSSDEGYSPAQNLPAASLQKVQSDRDYDSGVKSATPSSSGGQDGVKSGYSSQNSGSYEQTPLTNPTKSAPAREPKVALLIPTYRTKAGRSQLMSTSRSINPTSSFNQKSSNTGFVDTKTTGRAQSSTKSLLSNPTTSYLPALSPPSSFKSPVQSLKVPSSSGSGSQQSFPMKSQQQPQESSKKSPLTQSLPPSPASVARSRPSQNFNFPSSQLQNQKTETDSYPSYSASSNKPIFDDEEDHMSITPDAMGAYGLRTNSPYDSASASSHIRAVEQPEGSGRVVLLLFDKSRMNAQRPQMSLNAPEPRGVYQS